MLSPKSIDVICPSCGSCRVWRNGIRYIHRGQIQRWLCRGCGFRFSETTWNDSEGSQHVQRIQMQNLKTPDALPYNRQLSVALARGSKNLATVETRQEPAQREGTKQPDVSIEGEIIRYLVWLKNQAYSHHTIRNRANLLRGLIKIRQTSPTQNQLKKQ